MSYDMGALSRVEQVTSADRDLRAAALDATGSLIFVVDRTRRIVYFNRACEAATGRDAGAVRGRPCETVFPPHVMSLLRRAFERVEAGRGDCPFEARLSATDGSSPVFAWSTAVVRDSAGAVQYFVPTGIQVGEPPGQASAPEHALIEANRQLRQADRRKDEFIAMLSHELRNPLTPLHNCIQILEHAGTDGEPARRALQVLSRQVAHLSSLVEDLLDLTRISQGKIRLCRELLELNEVVRATAEDMRATFDGKGVEFTLALPDEPLRIEADRTRIVQVVANLLQNAAKFTPSGGQTELSLRRSEDGAEAVIEVRDSGDGIEPELLGQVFDRFVQASRTVGRTAGGLGLGLALVKELVELHDGRVHATSDGRGKGAAFSVWLPLDAPRLSHIRLRSTRPTEG